MIDRVACPLSCAKSNGSLRITRLWRTKPSSWKISLIGQRQWKALLKPSNATGNAEAAWLQQLVTEELRPRPGPHLSTHGVRQRGRRCTDGGAARRRFVGSGYAVGGALCIQLTDDGF